MKVNGVLGLLVMAGVCVHSCAAALTFDEWSAAHGKSYPTVLDALRARAAFDTNVAAMEALEASATTFTVGPSQFMDLTPQEFRERVLMAPPTGPPPADRLARQAEAVGLPADALPPSFDWRSKGAVTSVKNQGTVGTCWAFSTAGNIEGQWFLAGKGPLTSVSTEFLVDCDNSNCGVFGGYPDKAMEFVIASGGIPSNAAVPYCCGTGDCYPCMAKPFNETMCGPGPSYCNATQNQRSCAHHPPAATISSYKFLSHNETDMAQQLLTRGPLSVLMDATSLQWYKSGIWAPHGLFACDSSGKLDTLDHAVLLTGFGSSNGTDYWVVKNSWGESWGENGYFRLLRGSGECGINAYVTTAIV